jgi:endo-1,4-beta-D-glucanase Y
MGAAVLSAVALVPTTGAVLGGCQPETGGTGGSTTGGTSNTGGASSGGTSTGGTATGGTSTGGSSSCTPPANMLSDFEGPNGAGMGKLYPVPTSSVNGWWYSYKDTTNCSGSTLVPTPVDAKNGPVAAAALATSDSRYGNCNKYAMHSSISNCQTYSGFGAALAPVSGGDQRNPIDLSAYDGISFWAKTGSGSAAPLYLELVSTKCVPSSQLGTAVSQAIDQYNCHGKVIGSVPTTWTQYFVPFMVTGPRWFPTAGSSSSGKSCASGDFCEAPPLETSKFQGFQFALEDPFNGNGTSTSYDIWIDDVALYKFSDTPANQGLSTWTQSGTNAFPADKTFTGCTKPTGATGKLLRNAYANWKSKFVVADGSNQRVLSPEIDGPNSNVTVSEGMGYGMMMAAYMGDKPLFDGLLGYWKAHASGQSMLMTWKINGGGGNGSATDADEDTAFALQLARKQWGSSYDSDASTILSQILANDVTSDNYLKPGNSFGSKDMTNPSYFAPAFYKYFATADSGNASRWNALVTNTYAQLNNISGSNGLVPAWCSTNCTVRGSNGLNYTDEQRYQYDSHRTPWRIGLDKCWNNDSNATTYLNKVIGFFAGASDTEGLSSIGDIYNADGTPATAATGGFAYNSMSLLGCAGVGAMGSTASGAASFRDRVWLFMLGGQYSDNPIFKTGNSSTKPGYTYYNATVGLITAMTMSGNVYPM